MKQILRKELSREVKDGKEYVVNEYVEKELFTKEEIEELLEVFDDDEEGIFNVNIQSTRMNLCRIYITKLIDGLNDRLYEIELDGENEHSMDYDLFRQLVKKLEPYKDFVVDFVD